MRIRIKQLWKIPLYCVLAGWVSFQVIVYATAWFAVVMLPDGSYSVDRTRTQFFYILVFVAVVSTGGFLFRRMTKKEIFCSATIIVAFQMLMTLVQWGMLEGGDPNVLLFLYLYKISEWCMVCSQLVFRLTDNFWLSAFVENLMPYIFVLFGQSSVRKAVGKSTNNNSALE